MVQEYRNKMCAQRMFNRAPQKLFGMPPVPYIFDRYMSVTYEHICRKALLSPTSELGDLLNLLQSYNGSHASTFCVVILNPKESYFSFSLFPSTENELSTDTLHVGSF